MKTVTGKLEDLPRLLRDQRINLGITQEALGESLGLAQRTISRLENGVYQMNVQAAVNIATALGFELSVTLAQETEPMTPKPTNPDAEHTVNRVKSKKASELLTSPDILRRLEAAQQGSKE